MDVQTDAPPARTEMNVQTDAPSRVSLEVQTDAPPVHANMSVQANPNHNYRDSGVQADKASRPPPPPPVLPTFNPPSDDDDLPDEPPPPPRRPPQRPPPQQPPVQQPPPPGRDIYQIQRGDFPNFNGLQHFLNNLAYPIDFTVLFDGFTAAEKQQFYPIFIQYLRDNIGWISIARRFYVRFRWNNTWSSRPLLPGTFQRLLANLANNPGADVRPIYTNIIQLDGSDAANQYVPYFVTLTGIGFYEVVPNVQQNGAQFFPYLVKEDVPQVILRYLRRLQVFDTLLINNKQRPELNDCCFIWALKQAGIPEEILDKIRCRVLIKYQCASELDEVCKEHHIYAQIHKCYKVTNGNGGYRVRPVTLQNENQKRSFIGDSLNSAQFRVELYLFEGHYFIKELTPFTKGYVEHFDDPQGRNRGSNVIIDSLQLVKTLMKKNKLIPLTYS